VANTTPVSSVFDRQKSGYVRDFNVIDVFIFNVFGLSLGLALSTNPAFIGGFAPSANVVYVVLFGALLALLNGLTYGWFGGFMPSTGGDYIFVTRGLNHRVGFLTSWGFTACQIYGLAINIGWILTVAVAPALMSLGISLNEYSLVDLAKKMTEPSYVALGSTILLVVYFLLSLSGMGLSRIFMYPLFVLAMAGPILMIWALFSSTHAGFVSTFEQFIINIGGPVGSYELAIATAHDAGMRVESSKVWADSLRALPLGFLCFIGFTYSVYVGGEVLEPKKSQVRGILAALFLAVVVFIFGMGRYVTVVGQDFHSAIGFPSVVEKLGLPGNSLNLIVGMVTPSQTYNIFMQIGILVWFLLVPFVILEVCKRNLVAWSLERLVPSQLSLRSSRTDTHWVASLAVCILALICIWLNNFFGFSLVGAAALASVAFFFTGVSAYNLPRRNPDLFISAPAAARIEILGLSLFQIVGIMSAAGFLWVIYAAVFFPEVSGGSSVRTAVVLFTVYLSGLVAYEYSLHRNKQIESETGINLEALFKSIPED
jgi:basic amino acid/polyamine antiporter, APA family